MMCDIGFLAFFWVWVRGFRKCLFGLLTGFLAASGWPFGPFGTAGYGRRPCWPCPPGRAAGASGPPGGLVKTEHGCSVFWRLRLVFPKRLSCRCLFGFWFGVFGFLVGWSASLAPRFVVALPWPLRAGCGGSGSCCRSPCGLAFVSPGPWLAGRSRATVRPVRPRLGLALRRFVVGRGWLRAGWAALLRSRAAGRSWRLGRSVPVGVGRRVGSAPGRLIEPWLAVLRCCTGWTLADSWALRPWSLAFLPLGPRKYQSRNLTKKREPCLNKVRFLFP